MIIGKNTNLGGKNPFLKEQTSPLPLKEEKRTILEQSRTMQHTDVTSKKEMNDKAFAMLEDRLQKGLISMEDFNKLCEQLGKRK